MKGVAWRRCSLCGTEKAETLDNFRYVSKRDKWISTCRECLSRPAHEADDDPAMSFPEIAKELGISVQRVRVIYNVALRKLRKYIDDNCPGMRDHLEEHPEPIYPFLLSAHHKDGNKYWEQRILVVPTRVDRQRNRHNFKQKRRLHEEIKGQKVA